MPSQGFENHGFTHFWVLGRWKCQRTSDLTTIYQPCSHSSMVLTKTCCWESIFLCIYLMLSLPFLMYVSSFTLQFPACDVNVYCRHLLRHLVVIVADCPCAFFFFSTQSCTIFHQSESNTSCKWIIQITTAAISILKIWHKRKQKKMFFFQAIPTA